MTQEQKNLLISDLCGRLPYGVKISVEARVETLEGIDMIDYVVGYSSWLSSGIEDVKPYLFPLSSMTEEQRKEFIQCAGYEAREEENGYHYETYYYDLVGHENVMFPDCDGFDWLNKNHFDYRGLIEKDLALDATGLNIY